MIAKMSIAAEAVSIAHSLEPSKTTILPKQCPNEDESHENEDIKFALTRIRSKKPSSFIYEPSQSPVR